MQLDKMMLSIVLFRTWGKIKDMERFLPLMLLLRSSDREKAAGWFGNLILKTAELSVPFQLVIFQSLKGL